MILLRNGESGQENGVIGVATEDRGDQPFGRAKHITVLGRRTELGVLKLQIFVKIFDFPMN